MAVEEHSEDDKARLAMSTPVPNGQIPLRKALKLSCAKEQEEGKEPTGPEDDELTSLAWLQDTNLLKNFQVGPYGMEGEDGLSDSPSSDYLDDPAEHVTINADEGDRQPNGAHGHLPYHPAVHSDCKPPFSFSCLIFMAIEDSINKALPVKEIYNWILNHFPYFQTAPTGWKNSVRHNLSLSKCFRKVEKEKGQNVGKGSLWCIDPEFRPNLLQALQKTPHMANVEFSHLSCMSPSHTQNGTHENEIKPCLLVSSQQALQIPSPELFPYLSRRLASSIKDPEVDAAATMLTLKNGPSVQNASEESESDSIQSNHKYRKRIRLKPTITAAKRSKVVKPPVITTSPSEDHTYSACVNQSANSNDGPSSEEDKKVSEVKKLVEAKPSKMNSPSKAGGKNDEEEGANALLNLAEIASKRLLRKTYSKIS